MEKENKKYSVIAVVCLIFTVVSVAALFVQKLFYVAMITSVVFAIAALIFSIIGVVKSKNTISKITLLVSILVLSITSMLIEMLFEYVFIL